jgi:hypothetical protein
VLGRHIGADATAHEPIGGQADEARLDGTHDVVDDVLVTFSWNAPSLRKLQKYIFRLFNSTHSVSGTYSILKMREVGLAVSGHRQVNSARRSG